LHALTGVFFSPVKSLPLAQESFILYVGEALYFSRKKKLVH